MKSGTTGTLPLLCWIVSCLILADTVFANSLQQNSKLTSADYAQLILPDKTAHIQKWQQPIRVTMVSSKNVEKSVHEDVVDATKKLLQSIIKEIPNLDIDAGNQHNTNLFILATKNIKNDLDGPYRKVMRAFFPSDEELSAFITAIRNNKATCISRTAHHSGKIVRAIIVVDARLKSHMISKCLSHELLYVLGIRGQPNDKIISVLGADKKKYLGIVTESIITPTDTDFQALRIVYDKRIEANDNYTRLRAKMIKYVNN